MEKKTKRDSVIHMIRKAEARTVCGVYVYAMSLGRWNLEWKGVTCHNCLRKREVYRHPKRS